VLRAVAQNPVVRGYFRKTFRLGELITVELPTGAASLESFAFEVTMRGAWYVQEVTYDASAGLYDWLRHRVRLAPASQSHLQIETTAPIPGGDWIETPPEHVLRSDLVEGKTMGIGFIQGLGSTEPVPDIEARIHREDLDFVIHDLQPDSYTSDAPLRFILELADGAPAAPPSFQTIVSVWRPGDTIPLGGRALRVVGIRAVAVDETPVLIVEDMSE
jgi:hypothetical protein